MTGQFFDIHHHLLCGLDDGARDEQMMLAMLKRAAEDGIGQIIATVHAEPGVRRFDLAVYHTVLEKARMFCRKEGLGLSLYEGSEILYTDHACRLLQEREIPTLADTDRVLVEFSPDITLKEMRQALEQLLCGGFVPIIAHIERYHCFVRRPESAILLKEKLPVFYQVNCGSLLHRKNWFQRRFFNHLFRAECIDAVATDAHNLDSRISRMSEAYSLLAARYGRSYAENLTCGSVLGQATTGWKIQKVF